MPKKPMYLVVQIPVKDSVGKLEDYLNEMSEAGYTLHTLTVLSTKEPSPAPEGKPYESKTYVCVFQRGLRR